MDTRNSSSLVFYFYFYFSNLMIKGGPKDPLLFFIINYSRYSCIVKQLKQYYYENRGS